MTAGTASMIRSAGLVLAVLGCAGCSRDLAVPSPSTLAFVDAFPSAAPREPLALAVAGGARPLSFSFVGGAAPSGGDATLDAATGAYVAGSLGPAIDLVQVRDASGALREARISVGPALQVVPASAFVAPGGKTGFVASGGKPPYVLEILGGGAGTVQGTNYLAPASGGCSGSVSSPAQVALRLRDATTAAPIELSVTVGRGLDLFPAVGDGEVAPYEQIAFVASGGQPPYEFSMANEPPLSGGPGIDPGRGTYAAGPTGDVVDRVLVTDANGEQRCFDAAVGPPLALALSSADVRPGKELRLLATGGRPPYTFGFAAKGNRSRGRIDAFSGAYVPGLNALATDLVMVEDATGAATAGPFAIRVGPLQVATGESSGGCAMGDVNRDARAEAFGISWAGTNLSLVSPSVGGVPTVTRNGVPNFGTDGIVVADLDADGDVDVAYVDGDGSFGFMTGVRALLGQPDGGLAQGPPSALPVAGQLAVARGSSRVFASVYDTFPACAAGGRGIVALELDPVSGAFLPASCVASFGGSVLALAAGDWDGDGVPDVAYKLSGVIDRLYFRMGGGATPYATAQEVLVSPAPWRLDRLPSTVIHDLVEVRPDGQAASDLVAIAMDGSSSTAFRTGLAVFRGGPTGPSFQQVGAVQPGTDGGAFNLLGVSAIGLGAGARPRIAAWSGTDGTALVYDFPFATNPPTPSADSPASRTFRVGCIAAGDFDGDGIEDLFVAPRDVGPLAELIRGEGDGTYGRRPRFASETSWRPAGDLDHDGFADFAGPSPSGALEVLYYSDGELAVAPETPLDGQLLGDPQAGDWDGDGVVDLMARVGPTGFSFFRGLPGAEGRFAPAAPVVSLDAFGAPYPVTTVYFFAAELGGASPGPDLVAIIRVGSQLHHSAIRFQDATHAVVGLAEPLSGGTEWIAADLDGDGVDDLVSIDITESVRVALVKPGDPAGTTWPFRPWMTAAAGPSSTNTLAVGSVPVPGAMPARSRAVVIHSGALVTVDAGSGTPVVTAAALPPNVADEAIAAALGDVTGDGLPDVVVARYPPLPWLVFPGTADGLVSAAPLADLSFLPGVASTFSAVPGTSGAADLVVQLGGAMLVLRNDGAGHFR